MSWYDDCAAVHRVVEVERARREHPGRHFAHLCGSGPNAERARRARKEQDRRDRKMLAKAFGFSSPPTEQEVQLLVDLVQSGDLPAHSGPDSLAELNRLWAYREGLQWMRHNFVAKLLQGIVKKGGMTDEQARAILKETGEEVLTGSPGPAAFDKPE